ncbi:hypothetical protein AY633_09560 [Planococcus maritimus]|nr:hypothetical protein AY633_09560 [Planococcus maritimus]
MLKQFYTQAFPILLSSTGSDSPTSRQLSKEAKLFEQASHNEISQPPSAKGLSEAGRQVVFLASCESSTQSRAAIHFTKKSKKHETLPILTPYYLLYSNSKNTSA